LQLFYTEVYRHKYVLLIIDDCVAVKKRHFDEKNRIRPTKDHCTEHDKFFLQQISSEIKNKFIEQMKRLQEIKGPAELIESRQSKRPLSLSAQKKKKKRKNRGKTTISEAKP
jgi:hypothetical protein